jgi:hypothetical protein
VIIHHTKATHVDSLVWLALWWCPDERKRIGATSYIGFREHLPSWDEVGSHDENDDK